MSAALRAISPREASIFACLTDTVVAPAGDLPPVRDTDAVAFLDDWLTRSPALNRAGLRALLHGIELAPLALGFGARLRRLPAERRAQFAARVSGTRSLHGAAKLLFGAAHLAYYGDDAVMRLLGYDADANVARGRALRAAEGRW